MSGPAGHRQRLAARDDHPEAVNGIAGVGRQNTVTWRHQRQQQVRDPLLRADGHDRLRFGIERLPVSSLVPVTDGLAGLRQALRRHVALAARPAGLGDQPVHCRGRAGAVGIAQTEIVNVVTLRAQSRLEFVDLGQNVRGSAARRPELRMFVGPRVLPAMLGAPH